MTDFIGEYLQALKQQSSTPKPVSHQCVNRLSKNDGKRFDKSRLPDPCKFYSAYGFTIKGSRGWQMVKCPFHDDKHASMGVNREHGGFKCHACGASGDILSFYMQYHSVSFKDACSALQLDRG